MILWLGYETDCVKVKRKTSPWIESPDLRSPGCLISSWSLTPRRDWDTANGFVDAKAILVLVDEDTSGTVFCVINSFVNCIALV